MPKSNFSKRLSQLVYSFNTSDRYADFDSNSKVIKTSGEGKSSNGDYSESLVSPVSDKRSSYLKSSKLTSPILDTSFNSPQMALYNGFDIQNEGVSECILAWRHIELWMNKYYSDLTETLNPPVTTNDIRNAELDLDIEFPSCFVTSMKIHDGQDFMGSLKDFCGLFFSLELMSLNKVVEMTKNWRKVSEKINDSIVQNKLNHDVMSSLKSPDRTHINEFSKIHSKRKSSAGRYQILDNQNYEVNPNLEQDLGTAGLTYDVTDKEASLEVVKTNLSGQTSVPPNAVHDTYAHRDWIPILTDNSGNHVAIDLSPAASGTYGQVILFGREFDTKYVIAPNWGDFMLGFAKDLENGNFIIHNEELVDDIMGAEGELSFYDKARKLERNYFDVLKQRATDYWNAHPMTSKPYVSYQEFAYEEPKIMEEPSESFNFGETAFESHLAESSEFEPTKQSSLEKNMGTSSEQNEDSSSGVSSDNVVASTTSSATATEDTATLQKKVDGEATALINESNLSLEFDNVII